MGIRVVEAIAEDHLQVHVRAAPRELVHLGIRAGKYLDPGHQHALESLHRQDASGAQLGKRDRKMDGVVLGEVRTELLDVAQLAPEIELAAHHLRELTDDGDWMVRLQVVDMPFGQRREIGEHVQVGLDPALEAVLLNLDDDVLAAVQAGVVHLRDRG